MIGSLVREFNHLYPIPPCLFPLNPKEATEMGGWSGRTLQTVPCYWQWRSYPHCARICILSVEWHCPMRRWGPYKTLWTPRSKLRMCFRELRIRVLELSFSFPWFLFSGFCMILFSLSFYPLFSLTPFILPLSSLYLSLSSFLSISLILSLFYAVKQSCRQSILSQ